MRVLLLPLLVLAGCAATPEQQSRMAERVAKDRAALADNLKGMTPGKPVDCISRMDADHSETFGDAIVFRFTQRRAFVNQTQGSCFGLARDSILVFRPLGDQYCRGDIVRTIDRTSQMPGGTCTLGSFTPYMR